MHWYFDVIKKYAVFSGRARRTEYWMFALFSGIIAIILSIVGVTAHAGWIGLVYELLLILPSLGVAIRRLHDTGRTGWWVLIVLVPLAGAIVLLVFECLNGDRGPNRYGEDPKQSGPALYGNPAASY